MPNTSRIKSNRVADFESVEDPPRILQVVHPAAPTLQPHLDHIESEGIPRPAMPLAPDLGDLRDGPLLPPDDALDRPPEAGRGAGLHLDHGDEAALACYDIQLAMPETESM